MLGFIISGVIISIIVALLLTGFFYELISAQFARRTYAIPDGDLIAVGERKVHLHTMGIRHEGQPVVILESSVGANSLDWQMVQPLVAESAQVISYDRAGNGWSDRGNVGRNAETIARELKETLLAATIVSPYILVGHRYGGMYVRKYQELFPDDIAGLVLVDSSHPDVFNEESNDREITRLKTNVNIFQRLGIVRLVTRRNYRAKYLNEAEKQRYVAMMMHDNPNLLAEATPVLSEGVKLPESIDIPLMVVSRGEDIDLERERKWGDYQRDLVSLSDNAEHIHTETTQSWIVFAEPQTIADAILKLVNQFSPDKHDKETQ